MKKPQNMFSLTVWSDSREGATYGEMYPTPSRHSLEGSVLLLDKRAKLRPSALGYRAAVVEEVTTFFQG